MDKKNSTVRYALVTPFKSNGIDEAAYKKLIDWQIARAPRIVPLRDNR